MTISPSYRKPLLFALGLHLLLAIILIVKWPSWNYQYHSSGAGTKIVQATTVTPLQVQQAMQAIQRRDDAATHAEQQHVDALRQQAAVEKERQAAAAQRLVEMQTEQLHLRQQQLAQVAALAQLKKQEAAAQKKAIVLKAKAAQQAHQEAMAQIAKAAAIKQQQQKAHAQAQAQAKAQAQKHQALIAAQQRLQRQLLSQQLAGDSHQVQEQIQTTQLNGIIDKYKALIISAIGQQWLVPSGVDPNLSCLYDIQLAPGGVVLSVTLVKSSGNSALDQSAQAAIYKASPLPVPKDPSAFDNFRDLRLTVSPKQIT